MDVIPITFKYDDTLFTGKFHTIVGEDGAVWYNLFIGNYLYGQLFNTQERGWIFQSNRGMFEEQHYVDLFVSTIKAWKN